jgi:TPR repeat protein
MSAVTEFADIPLNSDDDVACNDARRLYTDLLAQNLDWTSLNKTQADQIKSIVKTFRAGAKKDHALSQHSLAVVCSAGHGIRQDVTEAHKLWLKASQQGLVKSMESLAQLLYTGRKSVKQDFTQAAKWWIVAAEAGSARSQHNLGSLYQNGQGVLKDRTAAVAWFQRSANQGFPEAQFALAQYHEHGVGGMPKSRAKALELYSLAAAKDFPQAQQHLERLSAKAESDATQVTAEMGTGGNGRRKSIVVAASIPDVYSPSASSLANEGGVLL